MIDKIKLESPYKIIEKYVTEEEKRYFDLDDILVSIASNLINYRVKNNLTQKELAQKLNMSQAMISKLESGEYNPTIKMLYEISKALDLKFKVEFREKEKKEALWFECSEAFFTENDEDKVNEDGVGDAA